MRAHRVSAGRRVRAVLPVLLPLLASVTLASGCTAPRVVRGPVQPSGRTLEVRFGAPRQLDGSEAVTARTVRLDGVTRVRGRITGVRGDTLDMRVTWWRGNGVWNEHQLEFPVTAAVPLASTQAQVYDRHFSAKRTFFGVVVPTILIIGLLALGASQIPIGDGDWGGL